MHVDIGDIVSESKNKLIDGFIAIPVADPIIMLRAVIDHPAYVMQCQVNSKEFLLTDFVIFIYM